MEEQYIYGRNPVMELLKNGRAIDKLYVQKGELKGSIGRILSLASQNGVIVQRVEREKLEHKMLFDFATFADSTLGRNEREEKCNLRTEFQRDRDRIIHSKSFRILTHQT